MRTPWLSLVIGSLAFGVAAAEKHEDKKQQPPKVEKKKEPRVDIAKLTDDPTVGKADVIDGTEMKGMVAFTFDDGPSETTTGAVIDACEKYSIPATFFIVSRSLVGKYGEKRRELLARAVKAGFLVGSHSFSHPNLKGANAKTLSLEIDEAIRILHKETGKAIGLFRAPFGAIDGSVRGWLKKRGLTEAIWSVDTLDWQARDAEKLRKKVIAMIKKQEGGVVLMHDTKPLTAQIIGSVFDDLEAENCRRLGAKEEPILPVSIHYFLRDKKKPRAVPEDVKKVTEGYRTALPARCAKRPPPPPEPEKKPDAKKPDAKKPDVKKP